MSPEMIAAVVSERVVDLKPSRVQPHAPTGPTPIRTAHLRDDCARIRGETIVARGVSMATRDAGLPCSYCVPTVEDLDGPPRANLHGPAPVRGLVDRPADAPAARSTGSGGPSKPPAIPDDVVVVRLDDGAPKPNRYAGTCAACGSRVAEMSGRLAVRRGNYVTLHREGECNPTRRQPQGGTRGRRRTTKRGTR